MTSLVRLIFLLVAIQVVYGCTASLDSESFESEVSNSNLIATPAMINTPDSDSTPELFRGSITSIVSADIFNRDIHQSISETLVSRGPGISYSRLLKLKTGPEVEQPSLILECDLCKSWEIIDPLTYRFQLREDVMWHNIQPFKSRPLVADDLVYSYGRQRTDGWPNGSILWAMDEVKADGDLTLQFDLKHPDVDFLFAVADGHSKIVSRDVIETYGGLNNSPVVGTGPWVWLKTEMGVGSDFEANTNYFNPELPHLQHLSFRVIQDPETQLAAFVTGAVDIYDVPQGSWDKFTSQSSKYTTLFTKQGGKGLVLTLNTSKPPFNDPEMRRLLFGALEPWKYLESQWSGYGSVNLGIPMMDVAWLLESTEMEPFFELNDSDSSIAFSPINFDVLVADYGDVYIDMAEAIVDDLNQSGLNSRITVLNPEQYAEKVWGRKDFQAFLGPLPITHGPNNYLFANLHSAGRWNIIGHSDAKLDQLIELQNGIKGTYERGLIFKEIQLHLLDKAYMVGIGTNGNLWAFQSRVHGFYPTGYLSEYGFWMHIRVDS